MTGLNLETFLQLLRADVGAWATLGLVAGLLALMAWTSWGSRRALRKCLVLSIAAHVGLVFYGSTWSILSLTLEPRSTEPAREGIRQVRVSPLVERSEVPGSTSPEGRAGRAPAAWDRLGDAVVLASPTLLGSRPETRVPEVVRQPPTPIAPEPAAPEVAPLPRPSRSARPEDEAPPLLPPAEIAPGDPDEVAAPSVPEPKEPEAEAPVPALGQGRLRPDRLAAGEPRGEAVPARRRPRAPCRVVLPDTTAPVVVVESRPIGRSVEEVAAIEPAGDPGGPRSRPRNGPGRRRPPSPESLARGRRSPPLSPPRRGDRPAEGRAAATAERGPGPLLVARDPGRHSRLAGDPRARSAAGRWRTCRPGLPLAARPQPLGPGPAPGPAPPASRPSSGPSTGWRATRTPTAAGTAGPSSRDGTRPPRAKTTSRSTAPPARSASASASTGRPTPRRPAWPCWPTSAPATPTRRQARRGRGQGARLPAPSQKPDGDLRGESKAVGMYCHAMAALALCEAYALTGDERLRDPVERAVGFLARSRAADGMAWRYAAGGPDGGHEHPGLGGPGAQVGQGGRHRGPATPCRTGRSPGSARSRTAAQGAGRATSRIARSPPR